MSLALACTWRPRGELERLGSAFEALRAVYDHLAFALAPDSGPLDVARLEALGARARVGGNGRWEGRRAALALALETNAEHVHYADFGRLARWTVTHPAEWRTTAGRVRDGDCLVIGRTEEAFATHPRALQDTERIINAVFSRELGLEVDLGGGSRGLSRRAAEFVVRREELNGGLGSDAAFPVALHRAGFELRYVAVHGLDWESADHHRLGTADPEAQRRAAETYDERARSWQRRVEIALEIIQAGLEAARPLEGV